MDNNLNEFPCIMDIFNERLTGDIYEFFNLYHVVHFSFLKFNLFHLLNILVKLYCAEVSEILSFTRS